MIWVAVIAGMVGIVFIHELGHFSVALAVGMRPRSFYIGFPPALVKVRRKGIEYGIGMIPLGGYVRIPGMHRPAASDLQSLLQPAIAEQASLAPAVLQVRRALDAEDYAAARAAYPELEQSVAAAHLSPGVRRTATRALRDVEEGTAPDAYWRAPTWKRISVIGAGPAANILAAFLILFFVYTLSGSPAKAGVQVARVIPNSPAAAAGLHVGDVLVTVDGRAVDSSNLGDAIRASQGRPITVTVKRDGRLVTLGPQAPVRVDGRWIWRFVFTPKPVPDTAGTAATSAAADLWNITSGTGSALASLAQPHHTAHLTSVVGAAGYTAAALRVSVGLFFLYLALFSMGLALINLIPVLPLDGGHILFTLIESVRRRPLAREVYERVSLVGLALLLVVFVIALQNDSRHWFS